MAKRSEVGRVQFRREVLQYAAGSEQQYKSIRQQAFQNLKVFLPCIRHTELVSQAPSWKLAEQQLNEVHVLSVTKRSVLQLQILQI